MPLTRHETSQGINEERLSFTGETGRLETRILMAMTPSLQETQKDSETRRRLWLQDIKYPVSTRTIGTILMRESLTFEVRIRIVPDGGLLKWKQSKESKLATGNSTYPAMATLSM